MVASAAAPGKYDARARPAAALLHIPDSALQHQSKPARVAIAGMLALAVAMGIGRFAFTPLLPMMLAEGLLDLPGAGWLASANYFGYLLGALLCTLQPWIWRALRWLPPLGSGAMVRLGLAGTCVFTLAMAWQAPGLWPLLRFAAGIASALVFVFASAWCLMQLAHHNASSLGGLMYAGPGAGIVISGLMASVLVSWHGLAAAGWVAFAALACVLSVLAWPAFAGTGDEPPAPPPGPPRRASTGAGAGWPELALFAIAYGLSGFGYIISATFLPVIARQALAGSAWPDMFWSIFGVGVVTGALLAIRVRAAGDRRRLLAGCYAVQAAGIAAGLVSPSLAGFAIGSVLLGLPFTTITFFAMQEARRLRPAAVHSFMGLLSVMWGTGQIAGPLLAAALLARSATPGQAFDTGLAIAAATLVTGALLFLALARLYPGERMRVGGAGRHQG